MTASRTPSTWTRKSRQTRGHPMSHPPGHPSFAGRQLGLFTPCVYSRLEASSGAYLYRFRADPDTPSNMALVNTAGERTGDGAYAPMVK